jgi:hypothetical protein
LLLCCWDHCLRGVALQTVAHLIIHLASDLLTLRLLVGPLTRIIASVLVREKLYEVPQIRTNDWPRW